LDNEVIGVSDESLDILLNEITMIGESDLDYEPILKNIYIHISTESNEDIPRELQRRVSLEKRNYFIKNEKLYKRSSYGSLFIPKIKERESVLKELHDGHGHFANEATYKRARELYYWPGMYHDIRKDIKSCIICQICDKKEPAKAKSSWPIHTNHLFERFGLDYMGPLTESSSGNQYIIVATEYYTKWPIAIATKTADGSVIARFL
jgi:hypothetical protein